MGEHTLTMTADEMPVRGLVLWQPWASLLFEVNPDTGLPYKWIETRSYPWPSTVPLPCRVLIYAAAKRPDATFGPLDIEHDIGGDYVLGDADGDDWLPLPLGCVLGSVVVTESLPIRSDHDAGYGPCIGDLTGYGDLPHQRGGLWALGSKHHDGRPTRVEDQRAFGDFTPDRFGWICEQPRRLAEPISEWWEDEDGGLSLYQVRGSQRVFTPPIGLVNEVDRRSAGVRSDAGSVEPCGLSWTAPRWSRPDDGNEDHECIRAAGHGSQRACICTCGTTLATPVTP